MQVSNDLNSILTLIATESIDLSKKLLKVNTEQVVQAEQNAVVEEAFHDQGIAIDIYA